VWGGTAAAFVSSAAAATGAGRRAEMGLGFGLVAEAGELRQLKNGKGGPFRAVVGAAPSAATMWGAPGASAVGACTRSMGEEDEVEALRAG